MDKKMIKDAIETINDAILDINDGDSHSEDFYWWNAVLNIFDLEVDDNGNIALEKLPKDGYKDRHRFFKEWD